MTNLDPLYSAARSLAIFGGGMLMSFGVISADQSGTVVDAVNHIIAGSKEIAIGVGALIPLAAGIYSARTHLHGAVLTAAAKIPPGDHDSAKIALVEALPDVAKIVVTHDATDGVAAAAADPARPKVAIEGHEPGRLPPLRMAGL